MSLQTIDHRNNFNLIRLLAAFQVLIVHIFNTLELESGFFFLLKMFPGVPIFFFISGYLISQSYFRSESFGLGSYAARRALRIFPALWVVTIFAAFLTVVTGFLDPQVVVKVEFWLWFLSQVSFVQFYNPSLFYGFGSGIINGALWTISVELQFYILMPLIAIISRRFYWMIGAIVIVSISANVLVHHLPDQEAISIKLVRVTFLPWVYMFIFGVILAQFERVRNFVLTLSWWALVFLFVLSMVMVGSLEANSSNAINPISAAFLMMLVLKLGQSQWIYDIPGQGKLRENDISYGVYVFHMPIINALIWLNVVPNYANGMLAFALTVLCAVISWLLVEKPALSLRPNGSKTMG